MNYTYLLPIILFSNLMSMEAPAKKQALIERALVRPILPGRSLRELCIAYVTRNLAIDDTNNTEISDFLLPLPNDIRIDLLRALLAPMHSYSWVVKPIPEGEFFASESEDSSGSESEDLEHGFSAAEERSRKAWCLLQNLLHLIERNETQEDEKISLIKFMFEYQDRFAGQPLLITLVDRVVNLDDINSIAIYHKYKHQLDLFFKHASDKDKFGAIYLLSFSEDYRIERVKAVEILYSLGLDIDLKDQYGHDICFYWDDSISDEKKDIFSVIWSKKTLSNLQKWEKEHLSRLTSN